MLRAINIVRVSQAKGEDIISPAEQRDGGEKLCDRQGWKLVRHTDEMDVSGGTPLAERHGLREAIEAVEQGQADIIVAPYFDRLCRSLSVQAELLARVEAAGGKVWSGDFGQLSEDTAAQWVSATTIGMLSEYQRRSAKERAGNAQAKLVEEGKVPFGSFPPGLRKGPDKRCEPIPDELPAVREAFRMRAEERATLKEIRDYLRSQGIDRTINNVASMIRSRLYVGEVRFGELVNPAAHEAVIDPEIWRRAQTVEHRGPRSKSTRLLACQGILRCGTCGSRMTAAYNTANGRRYPYYHCCNPAGDCPKRMALSATIAEEVVTEHVRNALAGIEGHASAEENIRAAEQTLEAAQGALEAAVRAFDGLGDEMVARERLAELRQARDQAQAHVEQVGGGRSAITIDADADWDELKLEGRRALIRAIIATATVGPGRGAERITIEDVA